MDRSITDSIKTATSAGTFSRINPFRHRYNKTGLNWSTHSFFFIFMIILSVVFILPLLVTIFASFKTIVQVASEFPLKIPSSLNLENYKTVFMKGDILRGLMNSMILVTISVVINTILTSMIAYCLSRFEFKLKKLYMFLFLIGMLVPGVVAEVGRFGIIKALGAYNTMFAPILIYAAADMMQIYIYLQFMEKIPRSLDESALIDGSSYIGIYFRIIFPLTIPATATLAIIKMIDIMNDMFIPYLYMQSPKLHTLTTALMYFTGDRETVWPQLAAAIIIVMLPTFILYVVLNKFIFKGIVAGAVKE